MEGYIGQIILFAGTFAPSSWAFCNGQLMQISSNTALFSILGTTYGGNGTTTFALPNLQGRVPVHVGNGAGLSPYVLGQVGGAEGVTLNTSQMPAHNHMLAGTASNGDSASPSNGYFAQSYDGDGNTSSSTYAASPSSPVTMNPAVVSNAGGSQPHPNLQPYLALNYIICLQGIYPSRS